MPKRLVDGDRIWTSDKIAQVEPESFRAEYANLLPLGLANGSFECEDQRVWRDVYAYNRPSVGFDDVQDILDEFERVRLLFRWHDDQGKIWGFWVGIKSEGLLPSKSQQKDYKKGKEPPADLLERFISGEINTGLTKGRTYAATREPSDNPKGTPREYEDGFGIGLDRDRLGIGDEPPYSLKSLENDGQGEVTMRAKKHIPITCLRVLGCKAETWDSTWDEVKQYEEAFGGTEVCYSFDEWAETVKGEIREKPVTAWLKIAAGLLSGTISLAADTAVDDLVIQLAIASGGRVSFDNKQKSLLSKGLKKRKDIDIVSGFKEYISDMDDGGFKFAGQKFAETVDQHAAVAEAKRESRVLEQAAADRAREVMVAEAEEAKVARKKAREAEDELIEDVLE